MEMQKRKRKALVRISLFANSVSVKTNFGTGGDDGYRNGVPMFPHPVQRTREMVKGGWGVITNFLDCGPQIRSVV